MHEEPGTLVWCDLTVENANEIRDFYQEVVGWDVAEVDMGSYADYVMQAGGEDVAGVCHTRGPNAAVPPVWIPYIAVADLERSLKAATAHGGTIIDGPRAAGDGRFCLIRDPAGAYMALFG